MIGYFRIVLLLTFGAAAGLSAAIPTYRVVYYLDRKSVV